MNVCGKWLFYGRKRYEKMRRIVKSVVSAFVVGTLALGGLAACSNAPKDTPALLQEVGKVQNKDNYHLTDNIVLDTTSGNAFKYAAEFDVAGKQAHATYTATVLGLDLTGETYVGEADGGLASYDSVLVFGSPVWTKTAVERVSPLEALTDEAVLKDATFAANQGNYTLTVAGDVFYDALVKAELQVAGTQDLLPEGLDESLKTSTATYTYDSEFKLTSISFATSFTSKDDQSTVTLTADYAVSNYGSVDAKTLEIPAEAVSNAIDSAEVESAMEEIGAAVGTMANDMSQSLDQMGTVLVDDLSKGVDEFVKSLEEGNAETVATEGADAAAQEGTADAAATDATATDAAATDATATDAAATTETTQQ